MSDLNVIQIFEGEMEPVGTITGEMEAIEFFPHPLGDSNGGLIIDSNGNLLTDATPGPQIAPLRGEITTAFDITGSLVEMEVIE